MLTNKVQATEIQETILPLAGLENAFCYWWIAAVCMMIGGLAGWFIYSLNSPIYEATAQFSIAVDYVNSGPLTQYDEDLAVNTAGKVLKKTEVLQQVVDQAGKNGINISLIDLQEQILIEQILIERNFSIWNLRVRNPDPKVAERLAMIWIRQGEAIIQQSYQHAIQAHLIQQYIQSQESCLEKVGANEPAYVPCDSAHLAEIERNLQAAGIALAQEKQASRDLFAGLTLGSFNAPVISQRPVPYGRAQHIFIGSLLGLLVGITVIELGASKFRRMKS